MRFKIEVKNFIQEGDKVVGIKLADEEILADNVVIMLGRDGTKWLEEILSKRK